MKHRWPTRRLGEVCQFRGGGTPSKDVASYWQGDIPWVSPKDMKSDVVTDSIDHISHAAIEASATSLIPQGSVLMVVRSGILARTVPLAITGRELTINQDLKALCPSSALDGRFLFRMLQSKADELLAMASRGATVHRLMTDQIRSLAIPVPPLPAQQRIVRILDEAFAGIATAKANTEKSLENARAIFSSQLASDFGIAAPSIRLDALAASITDGDHMPPPKSEDGIPFVTISNINRRKNTISFDDTFFVPDEYYQRLHENRKPRPGDVLYTVTGATLGVPVLVTDPRPFCFQRHIALVRPKAGVDCRWLTYAMMSPAAFRQATRDSTGTAQKTVSLGALRSMTVPPVPSEQQRGIADRLDVLRSEIDLLTSQQSSKLAALDALKKSLLHQAFSGAL